MHHTGISGRAYQGVPTDTDLSTGTEGLSIEMELPGMEESDIQVTVHDRVLVISGEKRVEREVKERAYHLSERTYGRFERQFVLPDSIDTNKIVARYRNGVLSVTAPHKAGMASAAKKIKIETR